MIIFKKIKDNIYLIIPTLCVVFWAFYYFIKIGGIPPYDRYLDFGYFYESGKQVLTDPINLYEIKGIYYLPSAATFFALTIAIFPLHISYYAFYCINIVLGILVVIEFNKILKLMDIEDKFTRFVFLILISNGWFLHFLFTFSQIKLLISLIFILIIKREIQCRIDEREKDLKYNFINYFLLVFIIGIAPNLIFLFFIFLFNDINIRDIFKKKNIQIYLLIIVIFIIQNFLFIIFPSLICDYLAVDLVGFGEIRWGHTSAIFYGIILYQPFYGVFLLSATIIIALISIILAFHKNLPLETKIGFFSLTYLLLGMYSGGFLCHMNMMFSLFLFIPIIKKEEKIPELIKQNKLIFLSFLIYAAVLFIGPIETIQKYIAITREFPFDIIVEYRYVFLISFYITSVILVLLIKYNDKKNLYLGLPFIVFMYFIVYMVLTPTALF